MPLAIRVIDTLRELSDVDSGTALIGGNLLKYDAATNKFVGVGYTPFTWQGAWSSATAYALADAVQSLGSSYIAIQAGTNHPPASSPTYWSLLASKGDTGATGATGSTGPSGANGAVWRDGAGPPSNSLGVDGDYYLNDTTADVYMKSAGVYSIVANIGGGTDQNYVHIQSSASTTWTINHNFGKYPSIQLFSAANEEFIADITHVSINQAVVTLSPAQSGKAFCN